jgi:hypothetical protein
MASVNSATWTWPADVLEFARENGIEQYLGPLHEAARRVFPMMKELRVFPTRDPENAEARHLVWQVGVPAASKETYRHLSEAWGAEFIRLVPAVKAHLICSLIVPGK